MITFCYKYTKKDYEIAANLEIDGNDLVFGDYFIKGDKYQQTVSPKPHKFIIHTHLSIYYDKYNLFVSSFSVPDISYLLHYDPLITMIYVASKEGIWSIMINPVYRGFLSTKNKDDIKVHLKRYNLNDKYRYLREENIHKLHNIFEFFSGLTGKSLGISSYASDTPIFTLTLDLWDVLRCNICI